MSDDTRDPYQAPDADLEIPEYATAGGSLEQTLAGNAHLEIGEVLSVAWEKTKGIKTIILGGFLIYYAVMFALMFMAIGTSSAWTTSRYTWLSLIQWLVTLLAYPFMPES